MTKANATAPAINVIESEKEYKVEVAAPGMTKEDFNVRIDEDNNLVISMEKKLSLIHIYRNRIILNNTIHNPKRILITQ